MILKKGINLDSEKQKLQKQAYSKLPKVDKLLQLDSVCDLISAYPRDLVVFYIRHHLAELRREISGMGVEQLTNFVGKVNSPELIYQRVKKSLKPNLRRVINAAGIILNTGLGRCPLSKQAQAALQEVSQGFSSVEIDLKSGSRGNRHNLVEHLLVELTGAEAAAVVNNNAAATLLTLNTLAEDKEVIVSRGELVTIGGSFRIPEIMRKSNAIMREIGTTNHTQPQEYEHAINEATGLLLKVHTSNYRIMGFVSETSLEELVEIGKKNQLPVMHDLGSGMLFDLQKYGLPKEPVVSESIRKGADVVTFSGDKLLGGPQSGIIVGKKKYIDAIKNNQLARALRCGKLTFAALEATLKLYFDEDAIKENHPGLKMMLKSKKELSRNARKLKKEIEQILGANDLIMIADDLSEVGGGSLATESLPTVVVKMKMSAISADDLARKLRLSDPPIVTRIADNAVIFDLRTLFDDEIPLIIQAIERISKKD